MSSLPKLYESPEICARISDAGAAHTGLKAGRPSLPAQAIRRAARLVWESCALGP